MASFSISNVHCLSTGKVTIGWTLIRCSVEWHRSRCSRYPLAILELPCPNPTHQSRSRSRTTCSLCRLLLRTVAFSSPRPQADKLASARLPHVHIAASPQAHLLQMFLSEPMGWHSGISANEMWHQSNDFVSLPNEDTTPTCISYLSRVFFLVIYIFLQSFLSHNWNSWLRIFFYMSLNFSVEVIIHEIA